MAKMMIYQNAFMGVINTMLFSWGSDAPSEAVWSANELLDWAEKEFGITINARFEEYAEDGHQSVLAAIKEAL